MLREKFAHSKPRIYQALEKKAVEGDVHAIKLALEMMKEYIPFSRAEIERRDEVNIRVNLKEALRNHAKNVENADNSNNNQEKINTDLERT